jgi:hypothetical protein
MSKLKSKTKLGAVLATAGLAVASTTAWLWGIAHADPPECHNHWGEVWDWRPAGTGCPADPGNIYVTWGFPADVYTDAQAQTWCDNAGGHFYKITGSPGDFARICFDSDF